MSVVKSDITPHENNHCEGGGVKFKTLDALIPSKGVTCLLMLDPSLFSTVLYFDLTNEIREHVDYLLHLQKPL